MRNNRLWLVLLLLPLLVATQVFAQGIGTGTINGRITDQEGQGLPGVTVTAKSAALQGARSAVTNVNGDYLLPNLPPGDYTLNFSMPGFTAVTKTTKVSAGQQFPINAKMSITSVAAEATVVAQSETVSQTSQASTTYSADVTTKLPVTRNYLSTVALSPGVNFNFSVNAPSISGSLSYDNVMTVNGVNLQDPVRGGQTALFIEDAIQETTTMTSGISAEYGRFTGGVINAVTKQGGNSFSGSFRVTLNNNDWRAQPPLKATLVNDTIPTYEATLGGPLWKDKIWFFGAGRYVDTTIVWAHRAPSTGSVNIGQEDLRYEGKLTLSPFQNHTLTGSYTNYTREETNTPFTGLPTLNDPRIFYDRSLPSDVLAINYNGVITSNFFVEAQYSAKNFKFENSGSRTQDLIDGTALLALNSGQAQWWGAIFCAVCPGGGEERNNDDILVKGTYFLSTKGLGSHNVAFGYQNFGIERTGNNWQSGSSYLMYMTDAIVVNNVIYPVVDESTFLLYAPISSYSQGSDVRTWSVFANDTWKLSNRLSLNLGLRYDKNDATDAGGNKTADDDAISPRLSVSYDVKGDGGLRLSASYARYVGQIQETQVGSSTGAGNPASYYYYWTGKTYNNPGDPLTPTADVLRQMFNVWGITRPNMYPNVGPDGVYDPAINVKIQGGLSSPYADEYALGVGGNVGQNMVYRVDAIRREYKNSYGTVVNMGTGQVPDQFGNLYDVNVVRNTDLVEREYTGLHSSLSYRLGALNLTANWTWSHLIGNINGLESTGSGSIRAGFEAYPEYLDLKWNAPRGDLSTDQRHVVRLIGSYDFKLGPVTLTPGFIQSYATGTPYGNSAGVRVQPYVTNPGYSTPPTSSTYWFTSRNANRTDDVWRTDLSLNLSGKIGPVEIFVMPQVWNLFNNQAVTGGDRTTLVGTGATASASTGLKRFNPFTETPIECPQTATAAECRALGANWKKGPNFGKPTSSTSYQIPRQWYITMGVRF